MQMDNKTNAAEAERIGLKRGILNRDLFGPTEIDKIVGEISLDKSKFKELREAVSGMSAKKDDPSPSGRLKLGVCQYLAGKVDDAAGTLKCADGVR